MILLRQAIFSDCTTIAKLHAESWKHTYRGIFSDDFLDNDAEKERIKVWHSRLICPSSKQVVTLAIQNEMAVGFSCVYLNDDPEWGALLDNLHVVPPFHGVGIGKILIKNCAATILKNGSNHKMHLWVFERNQNAIEFYKHLQGKNIETIVKQNVDGTKAKACKYFWEDLSLVFKDLV